MYYNFHIDSEDEELWTESLETTDDEPVMKEAVRIQAPISTFGLVTPLTAEIGTSMKNALKQLQQKKQNCLLVVDNESLTGILTERDILLKVTGKGFDLDLVTVEEFMTESPEYLSPEDPLAYALNKMHIGGFRHVPIVDDDLKPVGLISISDIITTIADYFSREIINLPPLDRLVDPKKQEGG